MDLIKYKKAFGIKTPLDVFPPKELKRRWRILCQKYHPDHGGSEKAFKFVQDAYTELKKYCIGKEKENSEVPHGIREMKVKFKDGYGYLWDVGEANFRKRYEWEKTHGVNLNKYY